MILVANPKAQYLARRREIDAAIAAVLASGTYIHGESCAAFESEFAAWSGLKHAVGVANGTDALRVALAAHRIGPGDEVIVPSHTAVATVAAVELVGAKPVFADIEAEGFTLDPDSVRTAITPRTKAVIVVHLYGNMADMERLVPLCKKHRLVIVEDCAQSHGAKLNGRKAGTWGDIAAYSFYPTKNLGALGDGGLVATNDPEIAHRCKLLREYGWEERFISAIPGSNSRLDELQAAVLRVKLPHLDADNERRRKIAATYLERLSGLPLRLPRPREGATHVYHLYVLRAATERDALREALKLFGIGAGVHYPVPVHRQPAYRDRLGDWSLPVTERAATEILSLPMYPELTDEEVHRVANAVTAALAGEGKATIETSRPEKRRKAS